MIANTFLDQNINLDYIYTTFIKDIKFCNSTKFN